MPWLFARSPSNWQVWMQYRCAVHRFGGIVSKSRTVCISLKFMQQCFRTMPCSNLPEMGLYMCSWPSHARASSSIKISNEESKRVLARFTSKPAPVREPLPDIGPDLLPPRVHPSLVPMGGTIAVAVAVAPVLAAAAAVLKLVILAPHLARIMFPQMPRLIQHHQRRRCCLGGWCGPSSVTRVRERGSQSTNGERLTCLWF